MKRLKKRGIWFYKGILFLLFAMPFATVAGEVTATSVTARQRYPWNGLVDVFVTLQGAQNDVAATQFSFFVTNNVTKTEMRIEHIVRNGVAAGSGNVWTQRFIWDAKADVGAVKVDNVVLTVDASSGIQLWENGPYWAECNLGAKKPEECGYYFWWGDIIGYKRVGDSWVAVDGSRTGFSFNIDNCSTWNKKVGGIRDAAAAHLGAPWRMPTDAEFSALINNCTTTWTTRNGVYGQLVTGKGAYAMRSIFLPAAGYVSYTDLKGLGSGGDYWSSTPYSPRSTDTWFLGFDWALRLARTGDRYCGQSVRPLRGCAQ